MLPTSIPPGLGLPGRPLPPPVPLEGSPLWERVLFEQPLLLGGPLVVLAVVALFTFNARGELKRGALASGALLAGAAALFLLAALVSTTHERVKAATRALVAAVATADVAAAGELLSEDAEIRYAGFSVPGRAGVLEAVGRNMSVGGPLHVASWGISELQSGLDGAALARSQVLVRATPSATGAPVSAWVLLKWERGADGAWRCFVVEPIDSE
jgi:ketosteroid isomerase-like protein